ncbi:hypothetical protein MVEN_00278900 [Mycena venus]|uniref:Autophagy-related protein 13 n=1 Tax=Mycena venus TaxID=2733690 RepID=A0A8H7DE04_9AGAR|nr:hypothetical protein MVEN_00278900 [Mycena venus]
MDRSRPTCRVARFGLALDRALQQRLRRAENARYADSLTHLTATSSSAFSRNEGSRAYIHAWATTRGTVAEDGAKAEQIAFHIYAKFFHVLHAARASEQGPGSGKAVSGSSTDEETNVLLPTRYKNAIPLFRALYALLRILPTWRVVRKLREIRTGAKAQWVLTDLINMAQFLEPHVPGDGNKYKMPVLKNLTEHLNNHIVVGGFKKLNGVKQKLADILVIYKGVHYLKTRSGGTWDNDFGANVITQTEADVWESLILSRPECTPFRSQGWPPYPFFERLDPAKPKGNNSYRPRIGVVGNDVVVPGARVAVAAAFGCCQLYIAAAAANSRHPSPDWDLAQLTQPDSQDQDDSNSPQLHLTTSVSSSTRSSTPSTPSASVAKCRATSSASSSAGDAVSRKKVRVNAQDALVSVSRSLNVFGERMSTATLELTDVLRTSNTNSSPERRARALEFVHKEQWLQLPDRIRLGRLVAKGQMADEYMSWAREGSPERKTWVCMELGYAPDYYKDVPAPE